MEVSWRQYKSFNINLFTRNDAASLWHRCFINCVLQNEGVYISKLNMILVQVSRHLPTMLLGVEWQCTWLTCLQKILCPDPEAGVAQTLAHLHQWHRGSESDQREPLSEQHDHPQTPERGGLWLLKWPDDPGEGQAPQRQVINSAESQIHHQLIPLYVANWQFPLSSSMCNEFSQIFQLCQFVMVRQLPCCICFLCCNLLLSINHWSSSLVQENSQNAPLVQAMLETLLRFLNWIPLGYIFETKLISTLIYKVQWPGSDGQFRNTPNTPF